MICEKLLVLKSARYQFVYQFATENEEDLKRYNYESLTEYGFAVLTL
jgi:hypothetical protein